VQLIFNLRSEVRWLQGENALLKQTLLKAGIPLPVYSAPPPSTSQAAQRRGSTGGMAEAEAKFAAGAEVRPCWCHAVRGCIVDSLWSVVCVVVAVSGRALMRLAVPFAAACLAVLLPAPALARPHVAVALQRWQRVRIRCSTK
jgi:hypothetical protein